MSEDQDHTDPARVTNAMLLAAYIKEAKANESRHKMVLELHDDLKKRVVVLEAGGVLGPLFKVLILLVALHWAAPGGLPQIVVWAHGAGR